MEITMDIDLSLQLYIPSISSGMNISQGNINDSTKGSKKSSQVNPEQIDSIPAYWSVLSKFSSSTNWPQQTVILPG